MSRVLTATEARIHFGELLRRVAEEGETVIVERSGKPRVVVVPVEEYERLTQPRGAYEVWRSALGKARERIRQEVADRGELTPPDEIIRRMRQERDARLLDHD